MLAFSQKSQRCRISENTEKQNQEPRQHICNTIWAGSSKSLEPAVCVEILSKLTDSETYVDEIAMDNNDTTMAHVGAVHENVNKNPL